MSQRRFPTPLAVVFALMMLAGLPGVYERLIHEHANTAGTNPVPWGLWVAAYTFFSGIAAGAFPIATFPFVFGFRRFRPLAAIALLTSLVSLAGAMIFVMADLGRPERAWHTFLNPNFSSMMFWVSTLYVVFGTVLAAMLGLMLWPAWRKRLMSAFEEALLRGLGLVGLVLSLLLAAAVGSLFAVLSGQSFWHSGVFPITFVISAMLSGAALVLAAATLLVRGGHAFKSTLLVLAKGIGLLLVAELVLLPAEALIVIKGGVPSQIAILRAIALGPYPWVFWGLQIGLGTVAAMLLVLLPKQRTLTVAAVASLLVLLGVFAFRLNFVIPQLSPNPSERGYIPNLLEWNLVVFGVGLAGLLFLAGYRLLPVLTESALRDFELAHRPGRA